MSGFSSALGSGSSEESSATLAAAFFKVEDLDLVEAFLDFVSVFGVLGPVSLILPLVLGVFAG